MPKPKIKSVGPESRSSPPKERENGTGPATRSREADGSGVGDGRTSQQLERSAEQRYDLFIYLGLLALIVASYWPVHRFGFVNYDDAEYVAENLRVQAGLTAENVRWAFRTLFFENWHPLTWLSYMLDYQLFGLNPGAFHLVNVFFHALNTSLLFTVFKRMTGARWPSAFVAGIFALHPLHVESVAWVSERKDVLSAFFWMLTLWAYVRYVERPQLQRYLLAILFFAMGLMAKPMLVTLPFVLLLLDFWPLRRLQFTSSPPGIRAQTRNGPNFPQPFVRLIVEKIPFFLLTALSCIITYAAQHGARVTMASLPVAKRLTNAAVSYGRYLVKSFWPENLAVYYSHPGQWPLWQIVGACLLLAAITALALGRRWKSPYLTVGWFWYLGMLVPVIGLVQVGSQSMADRYMYVPLIGLLIMVGWGAAELAAWWRVKPMGLLVCNGAALLGCLAVSRSAVLVWKDSVSLFEHALAVTTASTVAHNSLGDALLAEGKTNEAFAHFSAALEIDPEDALSYGNFGNILLGQGKIDEALAKYQKGLQFSPKNPELHHNAGLCLAKLGRFAEAIPDYSAALRARAEYADAYLNLGNALVGLGKFEEAITNYNAVLRLKPSFAPAHFNIGNALTQQGKHSEAAAHYVESLRLQPDNAEAHSNLAMGLAQEGKNREAITHLNEALRLKPAEAQFHFQLAGALAAEKRSAEAVAHYQEGLRLKPESVLALNNLAWMLATDGNANVRNGAEAVKRAQRACELTGYKQAFLIGTLAAAYAEAGQLPEAANTAQKATEVAAAAGQKEIAANNQKLLELYRSGKPYHEGKQP